MYKVFYNSKPLILTTSLASNSEETPVLFLRYTSTDLILKALDAKKVKKLYLYHSNKKKLLALFQEFFPLVEAAGGLVQHKNGDFLFIYRNDKWDLPKGKIEKKEMLIDAAVREVMEETGVRDLEPIKAITTTHHLFRRNGRYKLKKTFWYYMTTNYKGVLTPQLEENIEKAVWKSKKDIPKLFKNAYENIKELFDAI